MTSIFFLDTNVLIYSRDPGARLKQERSKQWLSTLIETSPPVINLQVINEFCHVALRKLPFLDNAAVQADAARLRIWGDTPVQYETVAEAWRLREAFGYQWFDCLLLAAARNLGCSHFLSEDMQHGQAVDGVTIINPFLALPGDFFQS
jgi:predicted nucleic acid-binding protein